MTTGAAAFADQRHQALALGNAIRIARSKYRHHVAGLSTSGGLQHVASLIESPPPELESMKARDLLIRIYRWGDSKADRALIRSQISPVKTLHGLTERQRTTLADYLRSLA